MAAIGIRGGDGDQTEWEVLKDSCHNGIRPGTHCNVWVQYRATRTGEQPAELTVYANVPGGKQVVELLGYGR